MNVGTLLRADAAMEVLPERRVQAYGVTWRGALSVTDGWASPVDGSPEVRVVRGGYGEILASVSSPAEVVWAGATDGAAFRAVRGVDGDVSFHHGEATVAVLSPDQRTLRYGDRGGDALILARTMLDSIMHTVALELGFVALHGAALAGAHGSIAVMGRSGAGKSSLAAALLERGLRFVADDIFVVHPEGATLVGLPAPPVTTRPVGSPVDPGTILGEADGELWLAAPILPTPRPVRALVVLEDAARIEGRREQFGLLDLIEHVMVVPAHLGRRRFKVLADLVDQVHLLPIPVHDAPPEVLAGRVLDHLCAAEVEL